ncbi:hypothetical protein ATANTOWER_007495 [Ataeniobius toweri]|uniref:Uncharacterized protein n=1 Tax=Ataeniobius toweri TaxID=208326 RepID=A0ABU7BXJ5_9TELE|nr:hypothetical protein [Ataeniobius toweri]
MWVKSVRNIMTEHSGQPNPAEAFRRTLSEQHHQITTHDSSLCSLFEQQKQTNQQIEPLTSLFQHTLSNLTAPALEGAAASPVSQQLPHSRDVTSPNPEKFSGEKVSSRLTPLRFSSCRK